MAQKPIREADSTSMLVRSLQDHVALDDRCVLIRPDTDLDKLPQDHEWLKSTQLVVKIDQLVKRRGKNNMVLLNTDWERAKAWVKDRRGKTVTIGIATGVLDYFVVKPFIIHWQEDEYYLAMDTAARNGDHILFSSQGGVNVGNLDEKARKIFVPMFTAPSMAYIQTLLEGVPEERQQILANFIDVLYRLFFVKLHYTFLEINPLVITNDKVYPLDMAAKIDDAADFVVGDLWGEIEFPPYFGRILLPEEVYIQDLDEQTGASLKLVMLNPLGSIWLIVAGGAASVVYADTVADLEGAEELGNYGEYSGGPNTEFTYKYFKTILDLATRGEPRPEGVSIVIGGGNANFTDVAVTFKGGCMAIEEYADRLKKYRARLYIRRAGPNYKEGLKMMEQLCARLGIPAKVYGLETHMTSVVPMALEDARGGGK